MVSEWWALLVQLSLCSALAILFVLSVRALLAHRLGAVATYQLWAVIPVSLLAGLLPVSAQPESVVQLASVLATIQAVVADSAPVKNGGHAGLIGIGIGVWLAGFILSAIHQIVMQRRFVRHLGQLRQISGRIYQASSSAGAPALVGALWPRIVLPNNFESSYTPEQQALIVLHEQTHLKRGDAQINALVATLRCVFWFNPLVHWAADRLRHDQELACDAVVLRQRPLSRRHYAEAILNSQLADIGLPVGCQWQSSHPMKERIQMIKKISSSRMQRFLATPLVLALLCVAATTAWAAGNAPAADTSATTTEVGYAQLSPPAYPKQAAAEKTTGRVLLKIGVGVDGKPQTIDIVSSEPAGVFDQAAMDAVAKWTFTPATEAGVPMASTVLVPVNFAMDDPDRLELEDQGLQRMDTLHVQE